MADYKLSFTAEQINEKLGKIDKLVKTVNGIEPDASGNVELTGGGGYATEQYVQNYAQPKGNYLTDAPVDSVNGKTGAVKLTASDVGALPNTTVIPTVPTKVSAFTNDAGYLTKHQDISGKADKTGLTLGIYTDGLIYLFVDGNPVGTGIELPTGGGDVYGYVDSENSIVLTGALENGTYNIKYEMEDGSTIDIGDLVLDTNVYYSITSKLTNCSNGNSATKVTEGSAYNTTITASSGYTLSSVTVTMGGTDVSSTAVSGGNISIANVTGNIVITATAVASGSSYTNQIPISTDANGNVLGIKTGYRLSLSSGTEKTDANYKCTGFIPVKINDIVRIKNIDLTDENATNIIGYDTNKQPYRGGVSSGGYGLPLYYLFVTHGTNDGDVYTATLRSTISNAFGEDVAYIRIGSKSITSESILTVNQEIV